MKLISRLFLFATMAITIASCSKEVETNTSIITGKIYGHVRDGFGTVIDSYYVAKEDVYLIHDGQSTFYDDDVETSYDGTFRFDKLTPGTYQLFVYEKCLPADGCPDNRRAVFRDITISEEGEVVDLGDINIYQ